MPKFSDSSYPKLTGIARADRIHAEDMSQVDPAQITRYLEVQDLLAPTLGYASMVTSTTMTGTLTLLDTDSAYQKLNPNGASRNVSLPTAGAGNHAYFFVNTATVTYEIFIMSGTICVAILPPGRTALIISDGAAWRSLDMEWLSPGETWTYVSASSFRVTGDRRSTYIKGRKLRWEQSSSVKYGVITSVTYSSPNTTVNILVNTDYVIANTTITNNFYSSAEAPFGFPTEFAFTPAWTNLTVGNGVVTASAVLTPNACKVFITLKWAAAPTTSISGAVAITLPVAAINYGNPYVPIGAIGMIDWGAGLYMGELLMNSTTAADVRVINAGGTYAVWSAISSSVPFTWGANDLLTIDFEYMW